MEEIVSLINQIIKEHMQLTEGIQISEGIANDMIASQNLDATLRDFMPRSLGDQLKSLENLQESLERVDSGIKAHFHREEGVVLAAFEKQGGAILASALRTLLTQHQELKNRFAKLRHDADELASGKLSRNLWEATAHETRAYIAHTRKVLEAHARSEEELLRRLLKELKATLQE